MENLVKVSVSDTLPRGCSEVDGKCDQHGESTALLHKRFGPKEWFCGECALERVRDDDRAKREAERVVHLNRIACLPIRYAGVQFEAKTPEQKRARATVRAFKNSLGKECKWAVLTLVGNTGTGKTLIACEMAQALIDSAAMSVRYCTANQMIAEIQAAYSEDGKTEEGEVLRFSRYDLLILDEIDAIRSTENAILLLTEVVNRRYNSQRPVVAITNQPVEKLPKFVGDRVFSRLQENALVCAHDWADRRTQG